MASYSKRLTTAHINAMLDEEVINNLIKADRVNELVSSQRVNSLVDMSDVFDPDRTSVLWQGSQGYEPAAAGDILIDVNTVGGGNGFYSVTMARGGYEIGNVLISIVENGSHARVYLEVGTYEATLQAFVYGGYLKFRVNELNSTHWTMTKIQKVG